MNPAPRIVSLGDLVLDVVVAGELTATRDARGAVRLFPGGSAANFAVAAARAGAAVTFFGRVGDDVAGRLVVAELAREGVIARVQTSPNEATGTILVLVGADGPGSTRMISDPGASSSFAVEDLDAAALAGADLVHVTGYSWLRVGAAAVAAREAVRLARSGDGAAGPLRTIDPGPAHLISAYGGPRFMSEIAAAGFDVLFPNLEEGEAMTGEAEPRTILAALRAAAPVVALKMGAEGCLVGWGERIAHVPAERVEVVDTTGAGDAFAAGFAFEYARSREPLAAASAGVKRAAAAVSRLGAR